MLAAVVMLADPDAPELLALPVMVAPAAPAAVPLLDPVVIAAVEVYGTSEPPLVDSALATSTVPLLV